VVNGRSAGRGEDLHQVAIGVAEVGAPAALAAVDLAGPRAGRVGEERDARVLDTSERDVEFLLADQERVVVRVELAALNRATGGSIGRPRMPARNCADAFGSWAGTMV
jgi:hypothetical protein